MTNIAKSFIKSFTSTTTSLPKSPWTHRHSHGPHSHMARTCETIHSTLTFMRQYKISIASWTSARHYWLCSKRESSICATAIIQLPSSQSSNQTGGPPSTTGNRINRSPCHVDQQHNWIRNSPRSELQNSSTMDVASGFWTIPVHPDNQHKLVSTFINRQYTFTWCPFGYANSPREFNIFLKRRPRFQCSRQPHLFE